MTAEEKLIFLAKASSLMSFLGPPDAYRFFSWGLLPMGQLDIGTCARFRRIDTLPIQTQNGTAIITAPRFQVDLLDRNPLTVSQAAASFRAWLKTFSLASDAQFTSPPTTPPSIPNFFLTQRTGTDFDLDPPVPMISIDFRSWNKET